MRFSWFKVSPEGAEGPETGCCVLPFLVTIQREAKVLVMWFLQGPGALESP